MKPTEMPPMPDAIVDEVRAIRADILAQFGNDVGKLCEHLREMEAQYGDRVVKGNKLPPRNRTHVASDPQR
jgi:hypothetical protein